MESFSMAAIATTPQLPFDKTAGMNALRLTPSQHNAPGGPTP
jgi:hypothetical protein